MKFIGVVFKNKILIKGYFKNNSTNEKIEYNEIGYFFNNTIKFKNNDTDLKIKIYNNKLVFIKEDNETKLICDFILNQETTCEYYLKQEKLKTNIPIQTKKIKNTNNVIEIEYYLLIDNINKIKNILHIEYEVLI